MTILPLLLIMLSPSPINQIGQTYVYTPQGPWSDGISGSISPNTAITVKETELINESVTGLDTDSYWKWILGVRSLEPVALGNAVDVSFTWLAPPTGEVNSGALSSNTITASSAGSVTHLFTRFATTFNAESYPVMCFDRMQLSDSSGGDNILLRDVDGNNEAQKVNLVFVVYVNKKTE
jgi:hypothetical protein